MATMNRRSRIAAYVSLSILAAAYMAPWVSIGSFINYYNAKFDDKFFVWLNTAFYASGLPISLLQGCLDERFDSTYGAHYLLLVRIVVCFMAIVVVCFLLPIYDGHDAVLGLVGLLGIFTWSIHGVVTTVASMFPKKAVGFIQFGFQLPNAYALLMVVSFGLFGKSDIESYTDIKVKNFYNITGFFVVFGLLTGCAFWNLGMTKKVLKSYDNDVLESQWSLLEADSLAAAFEEGVREGAETETETETDGGTKSDSEDENGRTFPSSPNRSFLSEGSESETAFNNKVKNTVRRHRTVLFLSIFSSILSGSFFSTGE